MVCAAEKSDVWYKKRGHVKSKLNCVRFAIHGFVMVLGSPVSVWEARKSTAPDAEPLHAWHMVIDTCMWYI